MNSEELSDLKRAIEENALFRLTYLKIKLTDNCNSRCKNCDFWKKPEKNNLSFEVVRRIIQEGKELGLRAIHLSGGEPTLRQDLEEIIEFASSNEIETRLLSNGILLDKKRMKALLEKGLSGVTFSLDSADPEQNDYVRGVEGAYKSAIENFRSAHELKTDYAFQLGLNCVVSGQNIRDLARIVALAKSLCADWVRLDPVDKFQQGLHGRTVAKDKIFSIEELIYYNKEIMPLLRKIQRETKQLIFPESLDLFGQERDQLEKSTKGIYSDRYYSEKICFSPFLHLTIYPDGSVMPCCKIPVNRSLVGNVHDQHLQELVNNRISRAYRRCVKQGRIDICRGCTMRNFDNDRIYSELSQINYFPKVK